MPDNKLFKTTNNLLFWQTYLPNKNHYYYL